MHSEDSVHHRRLLERERLRAAALALPRWRAYQGCHVAAHQVVLSARWMTRVRQLWIREIVAVDRVSASADSAPWTSRSDQRNTGFRYHAADIARRETPGSLSLPWLSEVMHANC